MRFTPFLASVLLGICMGCSSHDDSFTSDTDAAVKPGPQCNAALAAGHPYLDAGTLIQYELFLTPVSNDAATTVCQTFGGYLVYAGQVLPNAVTSCTGNLTAGFDYYWEQDSLQTTVVNSLELALALYQVPPDVPVAPNQRLPVICWRPLGGTALAQVKAVAKEQGLAMPATN